MQIEVFIGDNFSLFSATKSPNKGILAKYCISNIHSISCSSWKLVIFFFRTSFSFFSLVSGMHDLCYPQFSLVIQPCPTLCNPMDCSTPGLPVHQQLPEFAQTRVHRVGDAIQPSHPLSSPSPPVLNLSQHQGPFQGVSSSHQLRACPPALSAPTLPGSAPLSPRGN